MTILTNQLEGVPIARGPRGDPGFLPLGDWTPDFYYPANAIVRHGGEIQWRALRRTNVEPSDTVPDDWARFLDASPAEAARDAAVDARDAAIAASGVATGARDVAAEARDITTAARDVTTAARDVTTAASAVAVDARDDAVQARIAAEEAAAAVHPGVPDGLAQLDSTARITFSQLSLSNAVLAPTLAHLQALPGVVGMSVYMLGRSAVGDGAEGPLFWLQGNQKALCDLDPCMAVYIPPSGQDGSAGCWMRITPVLRAEHFGVVGDNVTPASTLLNAMFAFDDGRNRPCVVDPGSYVIDATLVPRDNLIVRFSPRASMIRAFDGPGLFNGVGSVAYKQLRISGGVWGDPTLTHTGSCLKFWADDSVFEDMVINGFKGGSGVTWQGDRSRIRGFNIGNTVAYQGNGGMRCIGGKDSHVDDCYVVSGDDCGQFVPAGALIAGPVPNANMSVERCSYNNCYFESAQGRSMIVAMSANAGYTLSCLIKDVAFNNCHGRSPNTSAGAITTGILVWNDNSSGDIDGVEFSGSVDMAGNLNNRGAIEWQNDTGRAGAVRNIKGSMRVRNTVGNAMVAENIIKSKFFVYSDVPTNPPLGTKAAAYANNCADVEIGGNIGVATGQVAVRNDVADNTKFSANFYGFANVTATFNLVNFNGTGGSLSGARFVPSATDGYSRILVGATAKVNIDADWSLCGQTLNRYNCISVTAGGSARIAPSTRGIGYVHIPFALDTSAATGTTTPTPDFVEYTDFAITMNRAATLQAPATSQSIGKKGAITITQDATGGWALSFVSAYKVAAGVSISTTANAVTTLQYEIVAANYIRIYQV